MKSELLEPRVSRIGSLMLSGISPSSGLLLESVHAGVAPFPWRNWLPRFHTKLCSLPISAAGEESMSSMNL